MTTNQQSLEYRNGRIFMGKTYRKYFLSPKLNRYLKDRLLDVGCGIGDGSFNFIIPGNVLQYIRNPASLLAEVKRVMRKAAIFLIRVSSVKSLASVPDHKVFYGKFSLKSLVDKLGFNVNVMHYSLCCRYHCLRLAIRRYCVCLQWFLKP